MNCLGNVQHLLYLHTIILNLKRLLSIFELVQVYDEKRNGSSKAKTLFNILYCLKRNHENLFHLMFEVFFFLLSLAFFACSFMYFNFFICIRRQTKVEAYEAFASGSTLKGWQN